VPNNAALNAANRALPQSKDKKKGRARFFLDLIVHADIYMEELRTHRMADRLLLSHQSPAEHTLV